MGSKSNDLWQRHSNALQCNAIRVREVAITRRLVSALPVRFLRGKPKESGAKTIVMEEYMKYIQ